jgi:hypothetical protein
MIRECQVSGISRVSAGNTGLIPAPAYNHLRSEHSPSEKAARWAEQRFK